MAETTREITQPSTLPTSDLAEKANADLKRMRQHSGEWRREAKEDYQFYAGDQWTDDDKGQLKEALRPIITFNRIQPIIDSVSGTEINNRQEVAYFPREKGDAQVNEIYTGAAQWARDLCDAEDEETDAFEDSLICGMGWTETRVTYEEEPDGQIVIERVDPMEMFWDTAARKKNLSDAKHIARLKDYDEAEFAERWPEWVGKIAPQSGQWDEGWTDDEGEAHFNDEIGYIGEEEDAGFDKQKRIYKVVEYQWYELENFYRTVNPDTTRIESLSIAAGNRLKDYLDQLDIPLVRQQRRVYHRSFMVGFQVLEQHRLPVQSGFTLQCITGKRDRNKRTWYGMIKAMKDPQRWSNKFFSQILHTINTNAKGGLLAEQNAFMDPDEAEAKWAAPDNILMLQDGALSGAKPKIMPKPLGQYPEGIDRLMQHSLEAFREVTGVNPEYLGQADAQNRSGVLEYQRKESALVILASVFNSLRRYRKRQGRILLEYIVTYISDGRLIRIMGKNGYEQYVPLVRQPGTITFDVIVDEAPTSPNQKSRVFEILTLLLPVLIKTGIPIPPDILDYLPLPTPLMASWKKMLEPRPGGEKPDPEAIKAQASAQKDQSVAQLNAAKTQTEQAKQQEAMAGVQGALAVAQAQMARIAELTPVDAAQAQHFDAKAGLERAREQTEQVRQATMLADQAARDALSREREETEEARQSQMRSQNGANSRS